jgi:hypothetical protein
MRFNFRNIAVALMSGGALLAWSANAMPTALADDCDGTAISSDLGQAISVVRCHGDWAYVSNGELGDSTMLVRLQGGSWQNYSGFPSLICRGVAAADGVPGDELSSFRAC